MNIDLRDFENFLASEKSKVWDIGNKILYDMCQKYPVHNNKSEIIAKLWLIGRSYAAAIERRKNAKESSDLFYVKVSKAISKSNLDSYIHQIPKGYQLNEEVILKVWDAHKFLTEELCKQTELYKISFVSKYLHFHCPVVPIYDSRAVRSMRIIYRDHKDKDIVLKNLRIYLKVPNKDKRFPYLKFLTQMHCLQKFIKEKTGKIYTMRDIDKYFLKLQED